MANLLTKDNLAENMRVKLQAFNSNNIAITNDTVHSDILSMDTGANNQPATATLYLYGIEWTIEANGGTFVGFPVDWLSMTVQQLADFIISKQTA